MNSVPARPPRSRRNTWIAVVVALIVVIGAEVGYLLHKHSGSASSSAPTSTSSVPTSTDGQASPKSPFPTYQNNVKLRADVSTSSCRASSGGWTASGTIDNTQTASHDFLLTVYFTDAQATVLGAGQASVTVGAGSSRPWTVAGKLNATGAVVCVLVGVQ